MDLGSDVVAVGIDPL